MILIAGVGTFIYTREQHISMRPSAILARLEGKGQFDASEALFKAGNPNVNEVALTFDDGPHQKYLPSILKTLRENDVHATFFEVGEMMAKSPGLVRDVLANGNEIGNHTMTHTRLIYLNAAGVQNEISQCAQTFKAITGKNLYLFRPPGFREDPSILKLIKSMGFITVDYTTSAEDFIVKGDFSKPDPQKIVDSVMKRLKPGGIILLHDAPGTAEALPQLLTEIKARGYRPVMVSELLAHLGHPVTVATNAGICRTPIGKIPKFALGDARKVLH